MTILFVATTSGIVSCDTSSIDRKNRAAQKQLAKTCKQWPLLSTLTVLSGLVFARDSIIFDKYVVDVVSKSQ